MTDVQALTDRINDLLNDVSLRSRFKINSQSIIRQQFHTDPGEYLEAYRTSIEQAFSSVLRWKVRTVKLFRMVRVMCYDCHRV